MKKTIPKLLTLVCLLAAIMGLSIVTADAATVTGVVSSGNEYRYHEDKSPVSQWGPYTSNKLKYFTRNDTGETVRAGNEYARAQYGVTIDTGRGAGAAGTGDCSRTCPCA